MTMPSIKETYTKTFTTVKKPLYDSLSISKVWILNDAATNYETCEGTVTQVISDLQKAKPI